MQHETQQELMRRFLLGELSEVERSKIEEQFLTDNKYFEELLLIEAELIDDYVLDDLSSSERHNVENLLLSSIPLLEELKFARQLIDAISIDKSTTSINLDSTSSSSISSRAALFFIYPQRMLYRLSVVVISVMLVLLVSWNIKLKNEINYIESMHITSQQREQELIQQLSQLESGYQELQAELERNLAEGKAAKPSNNSITTVTLFATRLTRGGGDWGQLVRIRPSTTNIKFLIELLEESSGKIYMVRILNDLGREIYVQLNCKNINNKLTLIIPSKLLKPGTYRLIAKNKAATGEFEAPIDYLFETL